jgi:hypothetical protein
MGNVDPGTNVAAAVMLPPTESPAARKILDRLGATYHSAWGGFSRF